ncbi:MAG: hypothetical protein LiPW39_200 [Parcubacteria group bacterium LiPW_39]|nr:MAG: hypothetical protein LiPW39_200 [Parcubacteria group bacterium LiPW_39]
MLSLILVIIAEIKKAPSGGSRLGAELSCELKNYWELGAIEFDWVF